MRPPRKAIEQIRNYCERTQCRKCIYGEREKIYGYGSDETDYVALNCKWQIRVIGRLRENRIVRNM